MSGVARLKYATSRGVGVDGLHAPERAVLDLWDQGVRQADIAERTGLDPQVVRQTVYRFSVTAHEPWKVDAAMGTAALGAALLAHFPSRCGDAR